MSRAATVSMAHAAHVLGVSERTVRRGIERHAAITKDPGAAPPRAMVVPGVRVGGALRVPAEWLDGVRRQVECAMRSAREAGKVV